MRPFFSRFGAKYRVARHLGPPRGDEVVEPFAGSACYSLFWEPKRVSLYDKDDDTCLSWDWLINCSVADVMRLPAPIRSNEEWLALPDGPRQVIYWNCGFAQPRVGRNLPPWYLHYINTGERTGAMLGNNKWRSWDESNRALIARQRPKLDKWTFEQLDYRDIPLRRAHWHVDPPYSGKPGRRLAALRAADPGADDALRQGDGRDGLAQRAGGPARADVKNPSRKKCRKINDLGAVVKDPLTTEPSYSGFLNN